MIYKKKESLKNIVSDKITDENKNDHVCCSEKQTKTRDFVEDVSTIKAKLNSLINNYNQDGDMLVNLLKNIVAKVNKIFIEGTYLFHIYLLYIIQHYSLCSFNISSNTIRRCCRHLMIGGQQSRLKTESYDVIQNIDIIEDEIILFVKSKFFNFSYNGREDDFTNDKGLMNCIDDLCDSFYTNIKVHICTNFKNYQKKYLFSKLLKYKSDNSKLLKLSDDDITENDIKFILYAVQHIINGNIAYSYQKEENIIRYNELTKKLNIYKFIQEENINLKIYVPYKIDISDELSSVTESEMFNYLKYFYFMQKELKINNGKLINIIPHCTPKMRYVRFCSRSMYNIYNVWKGTKIGVKDFEKNYQKYLYEMFTIETKYKKILKKFPSLRSISTDGCSISLNFEKLKSVTYEVKDKNTNKSKNTENKRKQEKQPDKELLDFENLYNIQMNKSKKGTNCMLFDATQMKASEEFLKKFNIGGVDIGNNPMMDITMENGLHCTAEKNYYNDISHVNRNKILYDSYVDKFKMNDIYAKLSETTTMTTEINEYMKYVEIIRENWNRLWEFNNNPVLINLKFNSFVYKEKGIARMAQEIIKKVQNKKNVAKRQKKYFNDKMFDEDKKKPILLAIGTGNGNVTISNTKNSSGKGPLKRLIKELSKYCVVVLVPEHNTSQLCCICDEYLKDINTYRFISEKKKKNKTTEEIKQIKIIEEETKRNTQMIHKQKKTKKVINNEIETNKLVQEIKILEKQTIEKGYYGKSYRLRFCAKTHNGNKKGILLERNYNASKNMIKMLRNLLMTGTKGHFIKKKAEKPPVKINSQEISPNRSKETDKPKIKKEK